MDNLLKLLTREGREHWSTGYGLIAVLAIVASALLVAFAGTNVSDVSIIEWSLIATALLIVLVVWWISNSIPRADRNHVGFGVAISFETESQAKSVEFDLISKLRDTLSKYPGSHPFQLIQFRARVVEGLDAVSARKLIVKSRCKFLIYGVARVRSHQGQDTHVFDLTGIVVHGQIPLAMSKNFSAQISSVFPSKLLVPSDGDFFAFEFTAHVLDLVIRYIVGLAAYITGDLNYAEEPASRC
jgi:hypothetical protein